MSILNRTTDGLLSVLIALRRTLLAYGTTSVDRLLALCAPPSVVDVEQDPKKRQRMAPKTLHRWTQLGFFVEDQGTIDIAPSFRDIRSDDIDGLRRALMRLVMDESNNPDFDSASEGQECPGAADFTRAVCWILAQDIYAIKPSWPSVEALQSTQNGRPFPFINDTRWFGFVEWSTFLGFSSKSPRLLFEPHFAISAVLDDVFTSEATLPVATFVARLAAALPVLDGGHYRGHVEATTKFPPYIQRAGDISISLSAALLHLEQSSILRLESRSDAATQRLLGHRARELASVSHITRGAGA